MPAVLLILGSRLLVAGLGALGGWLVTRGHSDLGMAVAGAAPLVAGELKPVVRKLTK